MKGIRGLIWDMDGTLLNTLDDIIGSCNETLRDWGLAERSREEMISFIGYGARHLCHEASGLEGEELSRFQGEYRQKTMSRDDPQTQIYPGIEEILKEASRRGIHLGIYTNKPQGWCEKLTEKFFARGLFEEIIGVKEGGVLKPSGEGIRRMCEAWGVSPEEVVMIGDSPVDIETARNGGCRCVCVSWGFRSREILEEAGAEVIEDTGEGLKKRLFGMS